MSIEAFWASYCASAGVATAMPAATAFGDSRAQQDELCALVLAERKRATAALVLWYERGCEAWPRTGDLEIVLDGEGTPRAVIELIEVFEAPFVAVDAKFAADEGEGDGSLGYWIAEHRRFFSAELAAEGLVFEETMKVVLQRFRLVWAAA